MNGIEFKVENKTGNILKLIFNNINLENYFFTIRDDEIHINMKMDSYDNPLKESMTGKEFKEIIYSNIEYYMIFLTLFAFNRQEDVLDIYTFEDLEKSKCSLLLICYDVTNIIIFFFFLTILKTIKENLKQNNIQYKNLTQKEMKKVRF